MSIAASIIVLNYNGEKILPPLLASLTKLKYPASEYEVIIVDNNSQDGSKKILQSCAHRKNWHVIFSPVNLGFAGGNNLAIPQARGKYLILLNNDCLVTPNWLRELIACAEKNPHVFSINSKIILYTKTKSGTPFVQNAGTRVLINGAGQDRDGKDDGRFDQVEQVYGTCGAASLYRRSIFNKIAPAGLDDSFFMYYEDLALSGKARILGYQNYFCPTALVEHRHAYSSKAWSPFFVFHVNKGRLLHLYYCFPASVFYYHCVRYVVKTMFYLLKSLLHFTISEQNKKELTVIADLIGNWPKYRRNKKAQYSCFANWKQLVTTNWHQIKNGIWTH